MNIQMTIDTYLLAGILFFVFLMWARTNPAAVRVKLAWRKLLAKFSRKKG